MGRPKKSIEKHKREGTYRPHRHAGPEPEPAVPDMPCDLDGASAEFWKMITPVLAEMGVLTKADAIALRLLCDSYSRFRTACITLDADGNYLESTNKNGSKYLAEHPAMKARARHWKEVVDMLRKFGLTPSDRTGLDIRKPDDSEESELARILKGCNN